MTMEKLFGARGWTPERLGSQSGKTFVITGTTSGTGREAARILLSRGARVVMLNRNAEKAAGIIRGFKEELGEGIEVSNVLMDLSMLDSVRAAAAEVLETTPRIDALICNAAIAQVAVQELTVDGFESQFGVNHLAHFLLCGLLFPRIETSGGRIVVVGSLAYDQGLKRIKFEDLEFNEGYSPWAAYAQSKLAQMMLGVELQRRVKAAGKDVVVQVCHPGASKTNLIEGESVSLPLKLFWKVLAPLVAQSAEKGAYPQLLCATEEGLPDGVLFGPTKRGGTVGAVDQSPLRPQALDAEAGMRLWDISQEMTSVDFEV